jgi:hypothetical protein
LTVAIGVVVPVRPAIRIWVVSAVCALPRHFLLSLWPGAAAGFEEHPSIGSASADPLINAQRIVAAIILIGVMVGAVLLALSH